MSFREIVEDFIAAFWPRRPADVGAVLRERQRVNPERLDWPDSVVDLMKLLDMDSSIAARSRLARKLGYAGNDPDGSAAKNIWLHGAITQKLRENGGVFPARLNP